KQPKEITVTSDRLEKLILTWAHNNGRVAKLLAAPQAGPKHAHISPEIKQYSFDRLVVCEHATIAQFLIANNFHFENNCAVLSIDKYPNEIFDTVMEMLRRNPALKVYALHDASLAGIQLTHRLTTESDWFQGSANVQIHDLGLLPRQILDRSVFVRESPAFASQAAKLLAGPVFASLRPEEERWLREGKYVELESISPRMLLGVVTQGIARSRVPGAEDALVPLSSRGDSRNEVYIFAYDSFG
ncbi:MAG TPA: MFS transporter permease, partial [Blastocatellia bacterium]|nr:MFS transporter permease [Blastocatellia bacterium]